MEKIDLIIMGDLYAGVAFGLDIPTSDHIKINERNILLVALGREVKIRGDFKEWFNKFYELFSNYENKVEKISKLKKEYQRIFEPPFMIVPPYESFYGDKGNLLGGASQEVLNCYEEEGFCVSKGYHDLPDHICIEMEFLSRLFYKFAENGNSFIRILRFMEDHVLKWVPDFLNLVKKNTEELYYLNLAYLTEELVSKVRRML